jgi:uncharacterized protein YecT (DUF1311 family)
MRRIRRAATILTMAGLTLAARVGHTGEDEKDLAWKATCDRLKNVPFPAADQPDEALRKQLRGCNSEQLFYGIGQKADPVKARACAYVELAEGDGEVFGGSAILMMIYATGVGATQNLDLAIHLACETEGAPAEMEGRVAHLERLKRAKGSKVKFDLCDDVTSGYMQGHCAAHDQRIAAAKRDRRFGARLARWTAPERAEFQRLRAAAGEFFDARSANEVDQSGTARAALQVEEEESLEKGFGALLDELERGTLPKATEADLAEADKELNATYQRALKRVPPPWVTVTKEGIREAERKWPKYRDAWAAFVKVKYPKIDPTSVKVRLTRERTSELEVFGGEEDAKGATK